MKKTICSNVNLMSDENRVIRFNKTRFPMKCFNSSYKSISARKMISKHRFQQQRTQLNTHKKEPHFELTSCRIDWTVIELVLIECNENEFASFNIEKSRTAERLHQVRILHGSCACAQYGRVENKNCGC